MKRDDLPGGAQKITFDSGAILFRWDDWPAVRHIQKAQTVWDTLTIPMFCPKCAEDWQPKDEDHIPLSCPRCRRYRAQSRVPRPEGYEEIPLGEWRRAKWKKVESIDSI